MLPGCNDIVTFSLVVVLLLGFSHLAACASTCYFMHNSYNVNSIIMCHSKYRIAGNFRGVLIFVIDVAVTKFLHPTKICGSR